MHTSENRAPSLNRFLEVVQALPELPPMNEHATADVLKALRAIVPHLPAIVLYGKWVEWSEGPSQAAVSAARAEFLADFDAEVHADSRDFAERDAIYLTGLLTGIVLADALNGTHLAPKEAETGSQD